MGSGSVQQLNINEVDTYGFWDQSLDIMPAMSRYVVVSCIVTLWDGWRNTNTDSLTLSVTKAGRPTFETTGKLGPPSYSGTDCDHCRSTDPRPKQWVLLSKTNEMVELEESEDGQADSSNTARLSVTVDGSKYS